MSTIEHEAYVVHIATECEAVEHGSWCRECDRLIWEADVADRMRAFEPVTVG